MTEAQTSKQFTENLLRIRQSRSLELPVTAEVSRFADELLQIFFPHFSDALYYSAVEIEGAFRLASRNLKNVLHPLQSQMPLSVDETVERFFQKLPALHDSLWLDAESIYQGDPAAESVDEVISAYPGFFAIAVQRIAHEFYLQDVPIFPRILTEYAHQRTGIDIHPGAKIGRSFFIDHGTGIVIGETTVIGDHVKLYQGVTLGALSVDKSLSSQKRHPTIENSVVIYSNATILGGETVIGHDSVIGGNVWLTESVPPHSIVYHKSEVRVGNNANKEHQINFVI
jgi:serine O-acetyltransferase